MPARIDRAPSRVSERARPRENPASSPLPLPFLNYSLIG